MKRIRCYDKNKMNVIGEAYSKLDEEIYITDEITDINYQRNIISLYNKDGTKLSSSVEIKELN